MNINPLLLTDSYKICHVHQYPKNTTMVYSNFTPRGTRTDFDKVVFFGLQYFIKEYLTDKFNHNFFNRPRGLVLEEYKNRILPFAGNINIDHIEYLHQLGYLPLEIKALPEGSLVPVKVPLLTIKNTVDKCYWLTNAIETLMSSIIWMPCTSATTSFRYRKNFQKYANETCENLNLVKFQGHDFSFRGMSSVESATISGAAHLLSFYGSDTVPAVDFLERYYKVNNELTGCSVPATEHSVMCMGGQETEIETFRRLMKIYPDGILSIVSDTWDYFNVLTNILPILKNEICSRNGKIVIRPDSSPKTPLEIICGDPESNNESEKKGSIQLLWELFGGRVNSKGYKELDSHIGLIYGESISIPLQEKILETLKRQGFASNNIVFGIGSYSFQYVTRDTYNFAIKSTYGEIENRPVEIYKNPKTDSGTKKSLKGLIQVKKVDNTYQVKDQCTWEEEQDSDLQTVFLNGKLVRETSLKEIRNLVESQL